MTIDYQALREAAEAIKIAATPQKLLAFRMKVTPQVVLALLDEIKRQEDTNIDATCRIAELETNLAALSVENELARKAVQAFCDVVGDNTEIICEEVGRDGVLVILEAMKATGNMPATDAFLAEVKTEARKEGAYFVANRMLAAWEAGFIDDTAKNAADIARMILTSTEFMANAPEGDFDRSFSDGVLEDIAAQLRKGGNQ
ncbi:ead/Ea22-like family protein [Escherichia marmotae]|uniref:ead/Ea22-like family protein n=1 Tax=Escherichia marmotae TaxID=1499973 RepID=UPI00281432A7|nr:ead/Ea22-like family protein [Escherichia marmotae]MDQ9210546.1 ead/Ea22-like family protein [Escherichia marmotae]